MVASNIPKQAYMDNKNKIGMHNEAGKFAFEVGLPYKSGVGRGIVALLPNKFCVATWSPGLNPKGNSQLGMVALEKFATMHGQSIF
jgi:glutaminase